MWWYDGGGWGWVAMTATMVVFWGLLVVGAVALYRSAGRSRAEADPERAAPSPERVLAERFARGDIDEEEYRRRLDVLHSSAAHPRA